MEACQNAARPPSEAARPQMFPERRAVHLWPGSPSLSIAPQNAHLITVQPTVSMTRGIQ